MNPNNKIYIAGHTGLVGSAVVHALQDQLYSNLILKKRSELDLLNQQQVQSFFEEEKPEYVIVCAAKVGGIKANMSYPADFLYENLQIQNNLIRSAHLAGVTKLLFLGSSCIYPRSCEQPMKEEYLLEGKPEPTNEGYSIAKIAGMKLCEKIYDQYGQTFISCMPTNLYGPGDNFSPEHGHVIPALMKRMHDAKVNNEPEVVIWGSGNSQREFLYSDDLAQAILFLMETYDGKPFLNVGTGEDIPIKELAYLMKQVIGYQGSLNFDTSKPDGMPRKLLDVTKINELGRKAKTSLQAGLEKTYQRYVNNLS
ncbi:MAG: GDP-L-fucose synthase [Candidatus Absconditabacterales bacterium]